MKPSRWLAALCGVSLFAVAVAGCSSGVNDPTCPTTPDPEVPCTGGYVDCSQWLGEEYADPWVDQDQDGTGACAEPVYSGCGYALGCDCNDHDSGVSPAIVDTSCDGRDSDCDGSVDEEAPATCASRIIAWVFSKP